MDDVDLDVRWCVPSTDLAPHHLGLPIGRGCDTRRRRQTATSRWRSPACRVPWRTSRTCRCRRRRRRRGGAGELRRGSLDRRRPAASAAVGPDWKNEPIETCRRCPHTSSWSVDRRTHGSPSGRPCTSPLDRSHRAAELPRRRRHAQRRLDASSSRSCRQQRANCRMGDQAAGQPRRRASSRSGIRPGRRWRRRPGPSCGIRSAARLRRLDLWIGDATDAAKCFGHDGHSRRPLCVDRHVLPAAPATTGPARGARWCHPIG